MNRSIEFLRRRDRRRRVFEGALLVGLFASAILATGDSRHWLLLGDFEPGWRSDWMERKLGDRPNRFSVVEETPGDRALKVVSSDSASVLWRELNETSGRLSWRWKIDQLLGEGQNERSKEGDDYPARLLVSFDGPPNRRATKALSYVWSTNEPVGSMYPNPSIESVRTLVLRSMAADVGIWVDEDRDLFADFRTAFGYSARRITAVAVIVDTDDTGFMTTAWFDDLVIQRAPVD